MVGLHQDGFRYLLARPEDKIGLFRPLFAEMSLSTEPLGTRADGSALAVLNYCLEEGVAQDSWMLWHFDFDGYLGDGASSFGIDVPIALNFDELEYVWRIDGLPVLRKPYSEPVSNVDADAFVERTLKFIMDAIKKQSDED